MPSTDPQRYEPTPENDAAELTKLVKVIADSPSFHGRAKRFAAALAHMNVRDAVVLIGAVAINGGTTTPYTFPDEL